MEYIYEEAVQTFLFNQLCERGFWATRELQVVPRDRVDIAVQPNSLFDLLAFFEVKVADPIRGVGQLLSYRGSWHPRPHCVLVVHWSAFNSQTVRACQQAEVEMWILRQSGLQYIAGSPTAWNAFVQDPSLRVGYSGLPTGAVMTCPDCNGTGQCSENIIEVGA